MGAGNTPTPRTGAVANGRGDDDGDDATDDDADMTGALEDALGTGGAGGGLEEGTGTPPAVAAGAVTPLEGTTLVAAAAPPRGVDVADDVDDDVDSVAADGLEAAARDGGTAPLAAVVATAALRGVDVDDDTGLAATPAAPLRDGVDAEGDAKAGRGAELLPPPAAPPALPATGDRMSNTVGN
jgi:hypothetical protein